MDSFFHQYCTVCDQQIKNSYSSLLYCSDECKEKDSHDDYRYFYASSPKNIVFSSLTTLPKTLSYTTISQQCSSNPTYSNIYVPLIPSSGRASFQYESEEINDFGSSIRHISSTVSGSLTHKSNGNKPVSPIYRTNSLSSLSVRSVELVTPAISSVKSHDMENKVHPSQAKEFTYPTKPAGSMYNTDGPGTGIRKLFYFSKSPRLGGSHES